MLKRGLNTASRHSFLIACSQRSSKYNLQGLRALWNFAKVDWQLCTLHLVVARHLQRGHVLPLEGGHGHLGERPARRRGRAHAEQAEAGAEVGVGGQGHHDLRHGHPGLGLVSAISSVLSCCESQSMRISWCLMFMFGFWILCRHSLMSRNRYLSKRLPHSHIIQFHWHWQMVFISTYPQYNFFRGYQTFPEYDSPSPY